MVDSFSEKYAELEDTLRRLAEGDGTIYLPNPSPSGPVGCIFHRHGTFNQWAWCRDCESLDIRRV